MTSSNAQSVRPFPQFNNVTWINPSIGNSTYHGGFVRAEKRMSGSFSFLAHYTFSKFIDDVEAANEFGTTGSYMDAYNRRLDKGLSGSDVPHRLVVTLLYEVRQFKGNRIVNSALGGWKVGVLETGPRLHRHHHQCISRRIPAPQSPPQRSPLDRRADRRPLVRYIGICESRALDLRQLAPLRPSRCPGGDHRCDPGKEGSGRECEGHPIFRPLDAEPGIQS